MPRQLLSRGGEVVSKIQSNQKSVSKKTKKKYLFSEQKNVKNKTSFLPKKKKDIAKNENWKKDTKLEDEDDELPKFPFNIKPRHLTKETLTFVTIRKIDEFGLAVSFPSGHSGYIRSYNISDQVAESSKHTEVTGRGKSEKSVDFNLSSMYHVGECVLTSVVFISKRLKLDLTMKPEVINQNIIELRTGSYIQGVILSVEDEGYIIDIGRPDQRGFLKFCEDEKNYPVGKSMTFIIDEILLMGRQINLSEITDDRVTTSIHAYNYLFPGMFVNFKISRQHKQGSTGQIFNNYGATLHRLQTKEIENSYKQGQEVKCRIILVNHAEKLVVLGNTENIMNNNILESVPDRDGEKVEGKIEVSDQFGLILSNELEEKKLFCPFYNITEYKSETDTLSQYPVGKNVEARIISYCYLEDMFLVTMRESVVEAKYFRYDELSAGDVLEAKVVKINEKGWIHMSVSPHLNGVITPLHQANTMLSEESISKMFSPGATIKCMVLDTTKNLLFLTAKPALIKSSLSKVTSRDELNIGTVTQGTIVHCGDGGVLVQFFNDIFARVPVRFLSHEFVEPGQIGDMFQLGQTIRTLIYQLPEGAERDYIGSFILDLKFNETKEESLQNYEIGDTVSMKIDRIHKDQIMFGMIRKDGEEEVNASIHVSDLSMSNINRKTLMNQCKAGDVLEGLMINRIYKKTAKLTNVNVVKKCIASNQFRTGETVSTDELYLGTIKKETDFGFFVTLHGGDKRALLHRASIVDTYLADHTKMFEAEDLVLVRTDTVDESKDRYIVNCKESVIEVTDLPEWLQPMSVFQFQISEINKTLQISKSNIRFGDIVKVTLEEKAKCLRNDIEPIQIDGLPSSFTAVCTGPNMQNVTENENAIFIGFHQPNVFLFSIVSNTLDSTDEKVHYMNDEILLSVKNNVTNLVQTRGFNGLLARKRSYKKNSKIETSVVHSFSEHLKLSTLNSDTSKKQWGSIEFAGLKVGQRCEGIIAGVKDFGVLIALGNKLMGRCMFKNVTAYFLPREKSINLCQKYLTKGKVVNIEILSCSSKRKLEVKLSEEYIQPEVEGLKFTTKRKKLNSISAPDEKIKHAKIDKKPDIEDADFLKITEMDVDMDDTIESEFKSRNSHLEIKENKGNIKQQSLIEDIDDRNRENERNSEKCVLPQSVAEWEQAVVSAPNNSETWLRYSTWHVVSGDIDKARLIIDRGLKVVNIREKFEKLNLWKARLNLEAMYGDEESLLKLFDEAKKSNEEEEVYQLMIELQTDKKNYQLVQRIAKEAVKKFPANIQLWCSLAKCQMLDGQEEKARLTIEQALQKHKSKDHVMIVHKFARLEFEIGDKQKGKALFDQLISLHQKRGDVYTVYADLLAKYATIDEAVQILENGHAQVSKTRARNSLVKRLIVMEQRRGDEEKVQEWRNKLE